MSYIPLSEEVAAERARRAAGILLAAERARLEVERQALIDDGVPEHELLIPIPFEVAPRGALPRPLPSDRRDRGR